jgi:carboxypeptidase T
MKNTLFVILLMISLNLACAQSSKYSRVMVNDDPSIISTLLHDGISLEGVSRKGEHLILDLSAKEMEMLANKSITYTVLIGDLSSYYSNRAADDNVGKSGASFSDYEVPEGFELGSCGGFCTLDQMLAHLDTMAARFPNLITIRQPISPLETIEGRQVYFVKISDNPNINENEPQVLYTGMHHAREPIGMQHLLFYMYYLLENYASSEEIRNIVDNTEMFFVPVLNVDGYQYNITTDPNGGGMWRKNRRINDNGSFGVDLNRNYGFAWGYDNEGSSPYPGDETYRGTGPFSEPETQMMRDFCNNHDFKIALNYHSYSGLLLYTWDYIPDLCPDNTIFSSYAKRMVGDNGYIYGPGCTTIYPSNGGSDDWMYAELTTKNKILSYTPEVGWESDGFWPTTSRIIPLCQENMYQSLLAAKFVGRYAELKDASPVITQSKSGYFFYNLQRMGLVDTADYTVSLLPISSNILSFGNPVTYEGISLLEKISDSAAYQLSPDIHPGDQIKYMLVLDNGLYQETDTVIKVYGQPLLVFIDSLNTAGNWTGSWALTNNSYHSGPNSITDSPSGDYGNSTISSCTLNYQIDLRHASAAILNYWARWDIEAGYDYVQVKVSANNGGYWQPMAGLYTKTGNSNQIAGLPLYDGIQDNWVKEEINLSQFVGQQIKLRFTLHSDISVVRDGFYFDDLTLTIVDLPTGITGQLDNNGIIFLGNPYPNPSNYETRINYSIPGNCGKSMFVIYASDGQIVRQYIISKDSSTIELNAATFKPGVYYYRLETNLGNSGTHKLIIN